MISNYEVNKEEIITIPGSDKLLIGFDMSENEDHCCLTVGRLESKVDTITILNMFYDDEARELYKKLTNRR